ncbi:MAG: hypothetical protein WDN47_03915 [Candidatus Doudnabacteria bacterium]
MEATGNYDVRVEDVQKIIGGSTNRVLEKIYLKIMEEFSFIWDFCIVQKW